MDYVAFPVGWAVTAVGLLVIPWGRVLPAVRAGRWEDTTGVGNWRKALAAVLVEQWTSDAFQTYLWRPDALLVSCVPAAAYCGLTAARPDAGWAALAGVWAGAATAGWVLGRYSFVYQREYEQWVFALALTGPLLALASAGVITSADVLTFCAAAALCAAVVPRVVAAAVLERRFLTNIRVRSPRYLQQRTGYRLRLPWVFAQVSACMAAAVAVTAGAAAAGEVAGWRGALGGAAGALVGCGVAARMLGNLNYSAWVGSKSRTGHASVMKERFWWGVLAVGGALPSALALAAVIWIRWRGWPVEGLSP